MRNKTKIYLLLIIAIIGFGIYLFKQKYDMEEENYVMTAGGLTPITNHTKNYGYKVLGPCKLWNPHPLVMEESDLNEIKKQLPEWLNKKYPSENINTKIFTHISTLELKDSLKYIYTIFWAGENDVYLLRLRDKDKIYKIYFLRDRDPENRLTIKDQKWMSMLDDPSDKVNSDD